MTTLSPISAPGTAVRFLSELRTTGAPVIRLQGSAAEGGLEALASIETEAEGASEVGQILADWHREAAEDLGGPALPLDDDAARLGAGLLFRAAWCYLQRGLTREDVARLLHAPPALALLALPAPKKAELPASMQSISSIQSIPAAHTAAAAAAVFSADLCLRHLPAIFRMAQTLSPGDPLLGALQNLAARFPLSGVGIAAGGHGLPESDSLPVILSHPGLRQLFLDRILTTRSRDWLHHPQIAEALQQTLGSHAQTLAPGFQTHPPTATPNGPPALPEPLEQVLYVP